MLQCVAVFVLSLSVTQTGYKEGSETDGGQRGQCLLELQYVTVCYCALQCKVGSVDAVLCSVRCRYLSGLFLRGDGGGVVPCFLMSL